MDITSLQSTFPDLFIKANHPLAPYTTLKIGGPADIFIHTKTKDEFLSVLKYLSETINFSARNECEGMSPKVVRTAKIGLSNIDLTILGNGSNVLISDSGIRGIVIKNTSSDISIDSNNNTKTDFSTTYTQRMENEPDKYLDFTKLNYDESSLPTSLTTLSSGTPLPFAINYLLDHGLTGLQWFAYIPGTIGGATWYNIHGGSYHLADYIDSVETFDLSSGQIKTFSKQELNWSYEHTYFQQHPELIILATTLRLFHGDTTLAKQVRDAWIAQKIKVQPMNSAGSCFANPALSDCQKIWGEQKSTGWIIDHELGWKGKTVGGAQISLQHSNFIINTGTATATDYYTLLTDIQNEVKSRFGLQLVPEVHLLGKF